jgi:pyrimidine operon attenuation protein/uracil phosphoribosyltransferase
MRQIMDAKTVTQTLKRLSYEIVEKHDETDEIAIIGIQRRGVLLARRIAEYIEKAEGLKIPVGELDITLYRDDLSVESHKPTVHQTKIDFDVEGKHIILVDDVLYTGRTVRCALSEIMDFGRPKAIELCVLVDRGHRELPIRADFVGKNTPTSKDEIVDVLLKELDDRDEVVVHQKKR